MARPTNNFFKLEMLILKILEVEDCYGYQIVQLLNELSNQRINVKEGTMYPILYRLIDGQYISDEKVLVGKRLTRVYYHIEPKGKRYLNELHNEYFQTIEDIDNIMKWKGEKNERT